jgi:Na+-transporting NADH:ubiquinone oxidoreductase subunit C
MKGSLYTVFYAAALGSVCAGLLTGVGNFTRPYREANKQAEKVRNILGVLEVRYEESFSSKQLLEVFEKTSGHSTEDTRRGHVASGHSTEDTRGGRVASGFTSKATRRGKHKELLFYLSVKDGRLATAAFAFKGQGVWGQIEGFLALEPDLVTVAGVTFHKQEETPGLGGEIASDWFREQFRGKSIRGGPGGGRGSPGIRIVKGGGASGPSEVDAITGATMTSQKVEDMLTSFMARILADSDAVRAAVEKAIREGDSDAG